MLRLSQFGVASAAFALGVGLTVHRQVPATPARPSDGYSIHVTAPHLYKGVASAPIHHFCKPIAQDPIIVCQLYPSADSGARLIGIEYIVAKSLTRPHVPLATWNSNFHDHAVEIASGRVQVLDESTEDAKKTADLVSTTDGIIFHLWADNAAFPTGHVDIDQAVGHKQMTAAEYRASAPKKP